MKILATILACSIAISGFTHEAEMNQLLSIQNLSALGINLDGFDKEILNSSNNDTERSLNTTSGNMLEKLLEEQPSSEMHIKGKSLFETYAVSLVMINGYTFHVADYTDGTRIVTALDGETRGLQAIGFNGIINGYSTIVEWHSNHFVHRYTDGKITSYSNKQVVELK
jgi:hypothetical protein